MIYDFECLKCNTVYEEFTDYDASGKYASVKCPSCKSKKKTKLISRMTIAGTDTQYNKFGYRAGVLMEKAKGERRAAQAASHMGENPFNFNESQDFNLDEGIHHPETRPGLS